MPARPADSAAHIKDLDSEAKFRAVFGLSPTILCISGLEDGRIREVNDTFLRVTGYKREEILGPVIDKEDVDAVHRHASLIARAGARS